MCCIIYIFQLFHNVGARVFIIIPISVICYYCCFNATLWMLAANEPAVTLTLQWHRLGIQALCIFVCVLAPMLSLCAPVLWWNIGPRGYNCCPPHSSFPHVFCHTHTHTLHGNSQFLHTHFILSFILEDMFKVKTKAFIWQLAFVLFALS